MSFFAKKVVDALEAVMPHAPPHVLHPPPLENAGENEARVTLGIQVRCSMLGKQPSQAARDGHASEHSMQPKWGA